MTAHDEARALVGQLFTTPSMYLSDKLMGYISANQQAERDHRATVETMLGQYRAATSDCDSLREKLRATEAENERLSGIIGQLQAGSMRLELERAETAERQLRRAELHAIAEAVRAVCGLPDNPSAESECETVRTLAMAMKRLLDTKPNEIEQARAEGYAKGKTDGWTDGFEAATGGPDEYLANGGRSTTKAKDPTP